MAQGEDAKLREQIFLIDNIFLVSFPLQSAYFI